MHLLLLLWPWVHFCRSTATCCSPYSLREWTQTTFTTFWILSVANGLLRFRIPLLFIISGCIFPCRTPRLRWRQDRSKRSATLLMIPFFIWSADAVADDIYLATISPLQPAMRFLESRLDPVQWSNWPYSAFSHWHPQAMASAPVFQLWFIQRLAFITWYTCC